MAKSKKSPEVEAPLRDGASLLAKIVVSVGVLGVGAHNHEVVVEFAQDSMAAVGFTDSSPEDLPVHDIPASVPND